MALIEKLKNIANAIRSKTNKTEELTLEQMASEVNGIYSPKAEEVREVTIENNGLNTITPSDGYDVMKSVKLDNNIPVDGLDLSRIYDVEQANELNQYYKDSIAYAEKIKAENPNPSGGWGSKFLQDENIIYFPEIDLSDVTSLGNTFNSCINLRRMPSKLNLSAKLQNLGSSWLNCYALKSMPTDDIDCTNLNTLNDTWYNCHCLKNINLINLQNVISFDNTFFSCVQLTQIKLSGWKQANIYFTQSRQLSAESIHYIIQNAVDIADGATARTLKFHETAKTNWQNSGYYEQDLAVLEQKGITIV